MGRRPNGSPESPVRSVRIDNQLWDKAKRRAASEQVSMSEVMATFVRGYADGYIDMPEKRVIYKPPTTTHPAS